MTTLNDGLQRLEELLYGNGVFSFCYNSEEKIAKKSNLIGDPSLTVVIHSDAEIPKIRKVLKDSRAEILRLFGKDVEISFEFLVYFISYLEFGEYIKDQDSVYLSTTFENIRTPPKITVASHEALAFDLKVIGIIEGATAKTFDDIKEDVYEMAELFNERSRYLKLQRINYGTLASRVQPMGVTPTLVSHNLNLGI